MADVKDDTELKNFLANDWNNFVSTVSVFGLITFIAGLWFKTFINESVKQPFSQELEDFKGDVLERIEGVKVQNQKDFFNYQSFQSKRHEIYPELYRLVETCIGYLESMREINRKVNIDYLSLKGIMEYCELIEMNNQDTEKIKTYWDTNRAYAVSEVRRIEDTIEHNKTKLKWQDANDFAVLNELFFSEEVASDTRKLLHLLYKYWGKLAPFNVYNEDDLFVEIQELKDKIEIRRTVWKEVIKRELQPVRDR
jgi:hypothetical protein